MKIAFLTYNRDPSIPQIDNDGCPVTARNYALQLSQKGHFIDIYVNRVIPTEESPQYIKNKFQHQQDDVLSINKKITIFRVSVNRPTSTNIPENSELSDFSEIIESVTASDYFNDRKLDQYDVVCVFHPMTMIGLLFKGYVPLKKTILFPMLLSDEYKKYQFVSKLYIDLETYILKEVGTIYSSSNEEKAHILKKGVSETKVTVIPRGFDNKTFVHNIHKGISTENIIKIVCVGSIRPQKRQDRLINVVLLLKQKGYQVEVSIIGDNKNFVKDEYIEYYNKILNEISKHDLTDNFIFTGSLTSKEISEYFKKSDIAIFPSMAESFGKAALESICSGVPTILCENVFAYESFAQNNLNAVMSEDSPDAYTNAIIKLVTDPDLYFLLSKNGLNTNNEFGWDRMSDILMENLLRFE